MRFVAACSRKLCQVQLGLLLHLRRRLFPSKCGTCMVLPKEMGLGACGYELASNYDVLIASEEHVFMSGLLGASR